MKIRLITLLLSIAFSQLLAQKPYDQRQSKFTYIYKLTNDQYQKIYYQKKKKEVKFSLQSPAVDSFLTKTQNQPNLQNGNYLFVNTIENKINYSVKSQKPYVFHILNNTQDLTFDIKDNLGNKVPNVAVSIKKESVPFNNNLQAYQLPKFKKSGVLKIKIGDNLFLENIKNAVPNINIIKSIKYSKLLRTTRRIKYDIRNSIRSGYATGFVERLFHHRDYLETKKENEFRTIENNSLLISDKPKYRENDTVYFKAILQDYSGRINFNKKLNVVINSYQSNYKSKTIKTIDSYENGLYESYFVLSDTLKMKLGNDFHLSLQYDDNTLAETNFKFEDYTLNQEKYTAKFEKSEYANPDSLVLNLSAKDDNDIPLTDINATVFLKAANIIGTLERSSFIADTLYYGQSKINKDGNFCLKIPAFGFSKTKILAEAKVIFTTSDNKIQTIYTTTHINKGETDSDKVTIEIQNDSIYIFSDKENIQNFNLTYSNPNNDSILIKPISLPFKEQINPYVSDYILKTEDKIIEKYSLSTAESLINATADRNFDSLFINIVNPRKLPYWLTIFYKSYKLTEIQTLSDFTFSEKNKGPGNYFLNIQYMWAGKLETKDFTIGLEDKHLTVNIEAPTVITPGSKHTFKIDVKDYQQKLIPNADLTVNILTKKFDHNLNVKYFNTPQWGQIQKTNFRLSNSNQLDFYKELDFNYFKYKYNLDSLKYYKFLYPTYGVYVDSIKLKLKTEFAPFVVNNGEIETIHMIYVDDLPIYFKLSSEGQRYSFGISPGLHKISIRTTFNLIHLTGFFALENHKNIISIDLLNLPSNAVNIPLKNVASNKELFELENYSMMVDQAHTQAPAYISQNNRYWFLENKSQKIGPIDAGGAYYKIYGDPILNFNHKGKYSYLFEKNQVTATSRNPLNKILFLNDPLASKPNLYETALTVEELDSLYADYLEANLPSRSLYDLEFKTELNRGTLRLIFENTDPSVFLKHILLLKPDDPNFLKVYPGTYQSIYNLAPDNYKIVFLFNDNKILEFPFMKIQKNGLTLEKINQQNIKQGDDKTIFYNQKVIEMLYGSTIKAGQEIKEKLVGINSFGNPFDPFDRVIRGRIVDSNGDPLPGVTVTIKRTTKGTMTNINGEFELLCPAKGVLVCSYVGFSVLEIIISQSNNLDLTLIEDSQMLQEVIVVGYGVQSKRNLSASVSMLQGRVFGVSVKNSVVTPRYNYGSGNPGANINIHLRGYRSIANNSQILIIKDGKPFYGIPTEEELESMDYLAGPAAVALYGSKAEAGVMIINTKKKILLDNDKSFFSETRSTFKDRAYWNARIKTNQMGQASFDVHFPDDITQWKTQIVAVQGQKYTGFNTANTKVFKPVAVNLSLPRFLVKGDSTEIYGKIRNLLSDTIVVNSGFETSKGDTVRFPKTIVASTLLQNLKIQATNLDSIKVKFFANNEKYGDAEIRKIPIIDIGSVEHHGVFFNLDKDSSITYIPKFGKKINIRIDSDPLDVMRKEIKTLHDYAYFCNEQLASKLIGYLVEKQICTAKNESFIYGKNLKKCIAKLESNMNENNTWGWWNKSSMVPWIHEHVVLALNLAKNMGYEVDYKPIKTLNEQTLFSFKNQSLESQLRLIEGSLEQNMPQAKTLLSQIPFKNASFEDHVRIQSLNLKLGLPVVLDSILKYEKRTAIGSIYYGEESYNPEINSVLKTIQVFKLLKKIGSHFDKISKIKQYFFETKGTKTFRNTYETALIVEALVTDLLSNSKAQKTNIRISNTEIGTLNLTRFPFDTTIISTKPIHIKKEGDGPLFISISESHLNPNPEKITENFEVNTYFEKSTKNSISIDVPSKLVTKLTVKNNSHYVMLSIPIIGSSTLESNQPFPENLFSVFYKEVLKDRIIYYINTLNKGTYTFETNLNPSFKGNFILNNAKAELMYFPFIMGREGLKKILVE